MQGNNEDIRPDEAKAPKKPGSSTTPTNETDTPQPKARRGRRQKTVSDLPEEFQEDVEFIVEKLAGLAKSGRKDVFAILTRETLAARDKAKEIREFAEDVA